MRTLTHTPVGSRGHESKDKSKRKSNDNDKNIRKENDKNIEQDCAQMNSHAIWFLKPQIQRQKKTKKDKDVDKHINLSGIVWFKTSV